MERLGIKRQKSARFAIELIVILLGGFFSAVIVPNFVRAKLAKSSNACANNLRQIVSAKQQRVLENNKLPVDTPSESEIAPYLRGKKLPVCPGGGVYSIGKVAENPQCSISTSTWPNDHVLTPTNSWWIEFKSAYGAILRRGLRTKNHQ